MELGRLSRKKIVLLGLVGVVYLADAWYAYDTWQVRGEMQQIEEDAATEMQNLRRLQSISQLSAAQLELATLRAQVPPSMRDPLPTSADTIKIVSDLINTPTAAVNVVSFKAKEPKIETVDSNSVQVLGYELGIRGSPAELLAVLRRVDESKLVSLRVAGFSMDRQEDQWLMKMELSLSLLASAQPSPTSTPSKTR